ncbi:helix-turn-helix domain-containing protein [Flavobacterium sp. TBRC 19031]|uniref:helix-turn-helix domain-containing protein n=1 Tax=Flavobacterium mekongense TaxID=3379707 RepID=UPI00399BBC5A
MFYLVGIVITYFLAFILLTKGKKTKSDKVLFLWLLFIGFHLFLYYLFIDNQYYRFPYLLGFHIPLPLIHGPFLYFYTATITNQKINWKFSFLHFIPFIVSFISITDFLLLTFEEKTLIYNNRGKGYEMFLLFNSISVIVSVITYVILSLSLLNKHKKNILNEFSSTERISLSWLRTLIYGVGTVWIFIIYGNNELLYAVVVLFVILIGYFAINQVNVFPKDKPFTSNNATNVLNQTKYSLKITEPQASNLIEISQNKTAKKYLKSGLNADTAQKIHSLLKFKMEKEEWFTNPNITLAELAAYLEIHPNSLSQVINSFENKNFYDYINSLRIKKFLAMVELQENQKFTLLALAFDCGFNSKSSFNKYFRKTMSQTPTDYLSKLNNPV